MRKAITLIVAVGLMAAVLALPATALGRAAFTKYTATEIQIDGPNFDPATDWTKPIVQTKFTSIFVDDASDPGASGTTYVSGKITLTDLATFTGIMRGTSVTYATPPWCGPQVQCVRAWPTVSNLSRRGRIRARTTRRRGP